MVQPGAWWLSRWWCRHRQQRLASEVGPAGHGMLWSRSQRWGRARQPGNRHRRSRARTNRSSGAEGVYPSVDGGGPSPGPLGGWVQGRRPRRQARRSQVATRRISQASVSESSCPEISLTIAMIGGAASAVPAVVRMPSSAARSAAAVPACPSASASDSVSASGSVPTGLGRCGRLCGPREQTQGIRHLADQHRRDRLAVDLAGLVAAGQSAGRRDDGQRHLHRWVVGRSPSGGVGPRGSRPSAGPWSAGRLELGRPPPEPQASGSRRGSRGRPSTWSGSRSRPRRRRPAPNGP